MRVTYLGFFLLLWFPGVLHAQSAARHCDAPRLPHGYIVSEQNEYDHGRTLTYACEKGHKPAVEGWWATSTCQSGTWSPKPQCIVEEGCIPPTIPNAKYTESLTGWYEEGDKIRITCDEAYELKNNDATAVCTNGSWSSVPVCERSDDACDAPPKVPHAVIVDHGYQELFAADTHLQYECEDGYTAEGAGNDKTIVCIAGTWTEGPTCSSAATPGAGHGGSTEGATGGSGTQPAGRGTTPSTGHGGGSSDSSLQPAGGGSSTTSDSNGSDSRPSFLPINNCGRYPFVPYAAVEAGRMNLRYRCDEYHTLVGLDTVVCHSDRSWSKLPDCKEKSCVLNPARYPLLQLSGFQHLTGAWKHFHCIWPGYYTFVMCDNGEITTGQCCNYYGHCL
ncbi:complement factor H-like [Acanthopagrus latus]|uniref:complement factor H-like n=1 Tax=Acanthopagrus latus TaxID=8177 RepID=UPI00187CF141|nr:complement factor H-like [Acanthopagrus latus]